MVSYQAPRRVPTVRLFMVPWLAAWALRARRMASRNVGHFSTTQKSHCSLKEERPAHRVQSVAGQDCPDLMKSIPGRDGSPCPCNGQPKLEIGFGSEPPGEEVLDHPQTRVRTAEQCKQWCIHSAQCDSSIKTRAKSGPILQNEMSSRSRSCA